MKQYSILLFSFFMLGATSLITAFQQNTRDKILRGFNTGDAEMIASFCNDESLMELFDAAEEYEGQKAIEDRLSTFFTQYPVRYFRIRHEGGKNHKTKSFIIGDLQCEGEAFRVSLAIEEDVLVHIGISFAPPAG